MRLACCPSPPCTLVAGIPLPTRHTCNATQDLHATCFDHPRDASAALWARFERIWALQINDDLARRGVGKCVPSRACAGASEVVTSQCIAVCASQTLP
jgi:hypothetical protein